MIIYKAIFPLNVTNPISIIKPIINMQTGEIMNDLCISNYGKIYKYSEVLEKGYLDDCKENPIRLNTDSNGRVYISINCIKGNKQHTQLARNLLATFDDGKYSPDWYDDKCVDHINPSVPVSNNLNNLRWTTHEENMHNAADTGIIVKKYKKPLIHEICKLISEGMERAEIADILNIPPQLVDDIHSGRSHKNVSNQYLDRGFEYKNYPRRPRSERLEEAENICKMLSEGKSNVEICKSLGVASGLVTSVSKGISYKDIAKKYNILHDDKS